MLEVCFNNSVKGALVLAQNCENGISGTESIAYITDKKFSFSFFAKRKALKEYRKRQIELQKQAVQLSTTREDVVGISFGFSEGDIKSPIIFGDCPRKKYIYSTFSFDRYGENENIEQSINKFWKYSIEDLAKLKSKPKKVRIWLDFTPDAQCGLLFVADLLKDSDTEICIIELPKKIKKDDGYEIEYRGWGEVEPQLFGTFLDSERKLDSEEIKNLSDKWQVLVAENALLRVFENGDVISTDESYYDDLIRKSFPQKTCCIAAIIGNALGKQKILTGDIFIAKRIQIFIANGELIVKSNTSKGFYDTEVQLAK